MNKLILSVWLIFFVQIVSAQKVLVFTNAAKNKLIEVREGQTLSLKYKGYLGQTEYAKQVVTSITDSTVALGTNPERFDNPLLKNNAMLIKSYKVIRISDITAFRRMTIGRQLLKSVVTVGAVVGSYFLLYDVYRSPDVSVGEGFLVSLGVGIGVKLLLDVALPEKPKYTLADGWTVTVVE